MTLGETEPSETYGGGTASVAPGNQVTFDRRELDRILDLYGRMVAAGEWRDYAIDFLKDRAVSFHKRRPFQPIWENQSRPLDWADFIAAPPTPSASQNAEPDIHNVVEYQKFSVRDYKAWIKMLDKNLRF